MKYMNLESMIEWGYRQQDKKIWNIKDREKSRMDRFHVHLSEWCWNSIFLNLSLVKHQEICRFNCFHHFKSSNQQGQGSRMTKTLMGKPDWIEIIELPTTTTTRPVNLLNTYYVLKRPLNPWPPTCCKISKPHNGVTKRKKAQHQRTCKPRVKSQCIRHSHYSTME
jgi:hypothetical protein